MKRPRQLAPPLVPQSDGYWRDLWARTALLGALITGVYFLLWEVAERGPWLAFVSEHVRVLHLVRGAGAACLLGSWTFLSVRQSRRACDALVEGHLASLERLVRARTNELTEASAFAELLLDSLPERIVVVDGNGTVVKANRVAERLAGKPLVGVRYEHAFADDERVWEEEEIEIPSSPQAVHARGCEPRLVIELARDVTDQRNLEAQLRHQEKMASLGLLAAGFAHDIGNPLASLSSELELLEGEEDVARFRDSLSVLQKQVARMTRMLREMVDFARRRRPGETDVSVAAAVADSVRLVSHDPRWRRVRLVIDVPDDLPHLHMVEDHLVLVLVNLALNATDAMPRGGELVIEARSRGAFVELSVRDTGVGMTPDVLEKAMTPLFTTKPAGKGTGLGLSVSSRVVGSAGGTMSVTSIPGVGTTVTIRLPTQAADASENQAPRRSPEAGTRSLSPVEPAHV